MRVKYNDPDFHPLSDKRAVYKDRDYLTVEDLKLFPRLVTLIEVRE